MLVTREVPALLENDQTSSSSEDEDEEEEEEENEEEEREDGEDQTQQGEETPLDKKVMKLLGCCSGLSAIQLSHGEIVILVM